MKILVIGGGGREHALGWKLAQSPLCEKIYFAPGNPGCGALGELLPLGANDLDAIADFAVKQKIGLVVVGPEEPLCLGLADKLRALKIPVFGPGQEAARLEGSKEFAKRFMNSHQVPTAEARGFTAADPALEYASRLKLPVVVKADGLAAGKGVTVCESLEQAENAIRRALERKIFGAAGDKVLVEEFMAGEEASLLCFCDGQRLVPMVAAQDHKRVGEGDSGPNTGGMGAYSPAPVLHEATLKWVETSILAPTLKGLVKERLDFRGCLYVGLMMTPEGPKVVEYNVRFGDPETQAVVARMRFDLAKVMLACAQGNLEPALPLSWSPEHAACVVLASKGYPSAAESGRLITGLEAAERVESVNVFHAGTRLDGGSLVSSGGRVLGVTARGASLKDALVRAYEAVDRIRFEGMVFRRDIGFKALKRL